MDDQRRPALGEIQGAPDILDMFDAIDERSATIRNARARPDPGLRKVLRYQKPVGPATKQRIRAALRTALNAAIAQQIITFNPASHIELPSGTAPKPLIWTDERVQRWRTTGRRPSPVMVWTPEQTGRFLDHAAGDPLYPLFQLIAYRGLRRGEACGLHWSDVDLDNRMLTVRTQLLLINGELREGPPKSRAGERDVALDGDTTGQLRDHRDRQNREMFAAGPAWTDTGLVFTAGEGGAIRPDLVSERFHQLITRVGLPPIRLHDLRHGAATLMLAAGAEMKVVQETLGHARYTTTANIYTSVLPSLAYRAAEATARIVPRQPLPTAS